MADDVLKFKRQIASYHSDETVRKLRDTFSRPSLFDIAKVSRTENMHSAFITWLLGENPNGIPLRGLLNIIIRRSMKQGIDIHDSFFTGTAHTVDNAETEHPIPYTKTEESKKKSGRIDVWLECSCGEEKYLIVIENKIDSAENGQTGEQTKDYYTELGDTHAGRSVIYVYLKPVSNVELSNMEEDKRWGCVCHEFIQINYQDILDEILQPLLDDTTVSEIVRSRVREYVDCLSGYKRLSPTNENSDLKESKAMAMTKDTRKLLGKFWNNNKDLIMASLQALSEDKGSKYREAAKEASDALKRDRTKYQYTFDGKPQSKPLGKAPLVREVVKAYAEKHSGDPGFDIKKIFGDSLFTDKQEKGKTEEIVTGVYLYTNRYGKDTPYFTNFLKKCKELGIQVVEYTKEQ